MTEETDPAATAGNDAGDVPEAEAKATVAREESGSSSSPAPPDAQGTQGSESPSSPAVAVGDEGHAPGADDSSPPPVASGQPSPASDEDAASPSGQQGGQTPSSPAVGSSPSSSPPAAVRAPMSIRARVFGRTDVGQVREHNEDNLLLADLASRTRGEPETAFEFDLGPEGGLLAVCDGMGGAAAGEIASQLAVDIVYEKMAEARGPRDRDHLAMAIVQALEFAGLRILAESNKNRACRGMGTTATVAAWVDNHLLLGQVGDSRGYLLRGERLVQITRDQSLVNQLIEAGQLTEEEAENFEHSNIILQALGTADAVQVDLTYAELRKGDVLLLCSDGLSGIVRDDELREIMCEVREPDEACRQLVEIANDAGGHDNITAIVAVFEGEDLLEASPEDTASLRYRKYPIPDWMDHSNVDTGGVFGGRDGVPYDDTPYIEVHGEIELGPEADWDDLFEDTPQIPTADGPSLSTLAILAVVVGLLVVGYFLLR